MLSHTSDTRAEADARNGLAGSLHAQGQSGPALVELHRTLILRERLGDTRGLASIHNNLGVLHLELGHIGLATEHLELGRRHLIAAPQDDLLVQILVNLSRAQGDYGDQQRAEGFAREGLSLAIETTDPRTCCALLLNLAESLREQRRLAEARERYLDALALARRAGAEDQGCRAEHGLALMEADGGQLEAGVQRMRRALVTAQAIQDVSAQILCLSGLARLEQRAGRSELALAHAGQALAQARAAARQLEELGAHDLLCSLYSETGSPARALDHAGQARQLERTLKNSENEQRVLLLNTIHDVEQIHRERETAQRARDQAELKVREQMKELERLALYDELTGLPNRTLFRDRLDQLLQRQEAQGERLIGVLDLNRFKRVNDALGRAAGDALLKFTVQRLQLALLPGEVLARAGGNEFLLLLNGGAGDEEVAARLLRVLSAEPMLYEHQELVAYATLGLARSPQDGQDAERLLRYAGQALHHAKRTEVSWSAYRGGVGTEPLEMDRALLRALKEEQFVLHHQPQIEAATGCVVGVETLLRWQHPERGLVPPGDFIPALEESNLILEVGGWVLLEACRQIAPLGELRVSVNVSVRQFQLGDQLIELVQEALRSSRLAPNRLELELTESLVMWNATYAGDILRRLREIGVRVSIDDFGTGHSSLAYIKHFVLDALKIDRAFIRELESDTRDRAIVETIAHLAHGLGMEVVAEGIETASQASVATQIGVDLLQGWHYARALPLEQLISYLDSNSGAGQANGPERHSNERN
ncbi:EAL domain-containing protein [Deinococcus altitudinis]|uniref:putative bifunctional diguanylate cyclase/phosphodiesterase n=1 Tax=Deinococcus altitudinis TaxID=468914 RepID=UPI003891AFFC